MSNVGNMTLGNITVTDPKVADVTYVSGDLNHDEKLQLDEIWIYSGTYAVTQADIDAGFVYNLATADSAETEPRRRRSQRAPAAAAAALAREDRHVRRRR